MVRLAAMFLVAVGLPAQQKTPPLRHDVGVTLKLITVRVTDRKGAAIGGLAKDDFVVFDGGRQVKITEFERHDPVSAIPPAKAKAETIVETPLDAGARPILLPRRFFVFLDYAFGDDRGIRKARQAALHFLDTGLRPGDEVGLITYSAVRGLAIRQFLTADASAVRRAVEASWKDLLSGRAENVEEEYWRAAGESRNAVGEDAAYRKSEVQLRNERNASKLQVRAFLDAIKSLAAGLRMVPGEKDVLLFSGGFAQTLLEGNPMVRADIYDHEDRVLLEGFEEMMKELGGAACVVYSFDTREAAKPAALFDYDSETFEQHYRDIFRESGARRQPVTVLKEDKLTGQFSLRRMALTTGGSYFSNIDEYRRNLAQVKDLTESYYVLGYPIKDEGDGSFRALKIEVRRPGCVVKAPSGYFTSKPFQDMSETEKTVRLFREVAERDTPSAIPLDADWEVLAHPGDASGRVTLTAALPPSALAALAGKKTETVSLVLDASGAPVLTRRAEIVPPAASDAGPVFLTSLALPAGSYKVRLVMRDLETGIASLAAADLIMPGIHAGDDPGGTPLALIEKSGRTFILHEDPLLPADRDPYAFDPSRFVPACGVWPEAAAFLHVIVPLGREAGDPSDWEWSGHLIDRDSGERTPLEVKDEKADESGGLHRARLVIGKSFPRPGRYTLTLDAENVRRRTSFRAQLSIRNEDSEP
jgi:VWFA-related protein